MSLDSCTGEELLHSVYDAHDFQKVECVGKTILKELKGESLAKCFAGTDVHSQCRVVFPFIGFEPRGGMNSYEDNKILAELFVKMTHAGRPYLLFNEEHLDDAHLLLEKKGYIKIHSVDAGRRYVIVPTDPLLNYASAGGISIHLNEPPKRRLKINTPKAPSESVPVQPKKLHQRIYEHVKKLQL